jgi:hypothetical protein
LAMIVHSSVFLQKCLAIHRFAEAKTLHVSSELSIAETKAQRCIKQKQNI